MSKIKVFVFFVFVVICLLNSACFMSSAVGGFGGLLAIVCTGGIDRPFAPSRTRMILP